jgi:peptide/nickel transport system permease protein
MPALTLASYPMAAMARLVRSGMLEVLDADYVRTARAKGLPERWVVLKLFPTSGYGTWRHLVLPALTLASYPMAAMARLVRSGMLEVLDADYVRTARAKGLPERWVVLKHTLKNAAMPIVTVVGLQFGLLLGGAIVCEMIFAWPGVGRLMIFAIYNRDFPLVEAAVFVMAMVFILANLLVDLCYAWLDPRVKVRA